MEFHRLGYPLFLLAVFAASWAVRGSRTARNLLLLGASWGFYAYAGPRFLPLLVGVTAVAWLGAFAVAPGRRGPRGLFLAALIAIELSGLVFFKYWDFVAGTVNAIAGGGAAGGPLPILHLAAVAGISFFSFQAVGYLIDVHRGAIEPERDALAFALFVGFFPQLLAGPIGRAGALLPQWKSVPAFSDRRLSDGLFLVLSGVLKKVVIADFLGTRLVNPAFAYPVGLGWEGVLLATWGFAFQLYGDFAGYSEMAIGSARCLGVDLMQNFDAPYKARNLSDFWQRWHISLSTWIRDYLFLPLSGRAPSRARTLAAAVVAMTLCGLWHGASFAWIAWGALHGAGLGAHQIFLGALRKRFALKKRLDKSKLVRGLSIFVTFHFGCALLLLVRAGDPALQGMVSDLSPGARIEAMLRECLRPSREGGLHFLNAWVVAVLALAAVTHFLPSGWKLALARSWAATPRLVQGAAIVAVAHGLFLVRPDASPFIYTNF